MFYFFDELTSTIDEARDEKYGHGDVVLAEIQTAGRGQRGKKWSSPPGKNLMFSAVLDTSFLRTEEQFLLLQTVALALVDMFTFWGLDARVKWTNDIYIGDCKIVGVLIDHSLTDDGMLRRSSAGIGINVNQKEFDPVLPNPTSMALELARELDRCEVLEKFYECLMSRFEELKAGGREKILADYHLRIYRLGVPGRFALPNGEEFTATISGVGSGGELLMEVGEEGEGGVRQRSFLFREITFII